MPSFSIELPADLLLRMDALHTDVDWSAIAAQAFELELKPREQTDDHTAAGSELDRLRSSDREHARDAYDWGHWSGGQYARHVAGADELRNLAALDEDRLEGMFAEVPSGSWTHADRLALLILAGSDAIEDVLEVYELENLDSFWEQAVIADYRPLIHDPIFLEGFVEGVQDAWEKQQSEL